MIVMPNMNLSESNSYYTILIILYLINIIINIIVFGLNTSTI